MASGIAIAFVLTFTLLSISPAVEPAWAVQPNWNNWAKVVTSASTGALIGSAICPGVGTAAGAAVGAICGVIWAYLSNGENNGAAYGNAANILADDYMNLTINSVNWAHTQNYNTLQLYGTSLYFFVQKAEWAAKQLYDYQTAHSYPHIYNPSYVLGASDVSNGTQAYQWAMEQGADSIFQGLSNTSNNFVGDYASMGWSYSCGEVGSGSPLVIQSTASSNSIMSGMDTAILGCTGDGYEWGNWACNTTLMLVNPDSVPHNEKIVVLNSTGHSVWQFTETNMAPGSIWDFSLNDHNLASGVYGISVDGGSVGSPYLTSGWLCGDNGPALNTSDIYAPGVLIVAQNGSGVKALGYVGEWIDNLEIIGASFPDAGYRFIALNDGTAGPWITFSASSAHYALSIQQLLKDQLLIRSHIGTEMVSINSFAQTYFNALVAGTAGPALPPSIIFPDPSQLANMTWQQIYAIYIAYEQNLATWFQTHSSLNDTQVNISIQSLDLLCRGPLYYANNTLMAGSDNNTVYTPYVSIANWSLTVNHRSNWTQPGFIIIWGEAANLNNLSAMAPMVKYVSTVAGDWLRPLQIYYQGHAVTSENLTVTKLSFIVPPKQGGLNGPQSESIVAWIIQHWYLLAMVFGVIVLLGGIMVRFWIIVVVGLVLVAAGVLGWYVASGGLDMFKFLGLSVLPPGW
jgi:hypothetical protein